MLNLILLIMAINVSTPVPIPIEECINGKVVWKNGTTSTCKLINEKGEKK